MIDLNTLLPTAKSNYERDGYLVVPNLYDDVQMIQWKLEIQAKIKLCNRENNVTDHGVYVFIKNQLGDYLKKVISDERTTPILHALLGKQIEFLSFKAVFKNQTTTLATPWHKDWFYWGGAPKISVWIALDDATPDNGCLKMIPGSHQMDFTHQHERDEPGFTHSVPSEKVAGLPIVEMKVKRGDAVFFHDQTMHASYPNTIAADRWSFISTYRNATVEDESTVWDESILIESGQSCCSK